MLSIPLPRRTSSVVSLPVDLFPIYFELCPLVPELTRLLLKMASNVRFELPTAVRITVLFPWVVTSCGLVGAYQRFGETYCVVSAEDGDGVFLRNVSVCRRVCKASKSRRAATLASNVTCL
jgi:hypothetical protein